MFFDRPDSGELAVLVHLDIASEREPEDCREFEELVLSAGGDPVAVIGGHRQTPQSRYFIGTGKLQELADLVREHDAKLVIFNHPLSPSQERNLEQVLCCRVIDRIGLILDIFAQRAQTHEGKLQVELAQLQHLSTRLVRGWTHLERQKGGIGLRGPGETQLESDRRMVRARIKAIQKRLEKVRGQRAQGRRRRRRAEIPTVSLVGYTNAGKSTLFNMLANASTFVADQLFATLDPTMRRLVLDQVGPVIVADTVGFISHLPHKLVEAFRATLEEAAQASLLLHVIDAASDTRHQNIERVNEVLEEIGAADIPVLMVYNKIDLLEGVEPRIERDARNKPVGVWLSGHTGAGLALLMQAMVELLSGAIHQGTYYLTPQQARLRAQFYRVNGVVNERSTENGGTILQVRLAQADFSRLLKAAGIDAQDLASVPDETVPQTLARSA